MLSHNRKLSKHDMSMSITQWHIARNLHIRRLKQIINLTRNNNKSSSRIFMKKISQFMLRRPQEETQPILILYNLMSNLPEVAVLYLIRRNQQSKMQWSTEGTMSKQINNKSLKNQISIYLSQPNKTVRSSFNNRNYIIQIQEVLLDQT